jgi:hypothetical protein
MRWSSLFLYRAVAAALFLGSLGSCSDPSSPDDDLPAGLNVVRLRDDAPPLQSSVVSFFAVRGQARSGSVYFSNAQGVRTSEYIRLEIPAGALVTRPDGSAIAAGDSLRITITVTDPKRIRFRLQPEGLTFAAGSPARLVTSYAEANFDFNADGRVDAADLLIETQLANFRQARSGDPFLRLVSIINLQLDGISSDLPGFSQYAVAY